MNDNIEAVRRLVAEVLKMPPADVPTDASAESLAEWDSLAHLNVCLMFEERFGVKLDMETIASATSVPALAALLAGRQT